ncbi:MAG: 2OG-Fe(II) oxygenase [Steroidobacteraceae bacterium]|nr:2OG-Fe(II) oxygenase [Steroidobacteraceae bacterium]
MVTETEARVRAESGDAAAQLALAVHLDRQGEHLQALDWLRRAAQAGHAPAQYFLGARLIVGRAAPVEPTQGAALVSEAARQGMPEALALMALLATLSGDWNSAMRLMRDAAARGHPLAREQLALLEGPSGPAAEAWQALPQTHWLSESPRIGVIEAFLARPVCDWIVARARPKLEAVRVKDPLRGAQKAEYRSNSGAGFSLLESDLVLQRVNARVALAAGLPLANQEPANVLHYLPGEEYRPHHDFVTRSAQNEAELRACGQRAATLLVYLNDDCAGGETEFPELGLRYRGRAGDALLFYNLTPEGEPDPRTLHAGLPPASGEKWLYSKWIRQRPYPLL